jgi:hypothetical protein
MVQQIASQADRSALSSLSDSGFGLRYLYQHLGYVPQNGERARRHRLDRFGDRKHAI